MMQYVHLIGLILTCSVTIFWNAHSIQSADHAISANHEISHEISSEISTEISSTVKEEDELDDAEPNSLRKSDGFMWRRSDSEEPSRSRGRVYYNVLDKGAVGDGIANDTDAFLAAWASACKVKNATVYVPYGYKYLVYPSVYSGPCQWDLQFEVEGEIRAPTDISAWDGRNVHFWILFQKLEGFAIVGKGSFNGRGQNWWACRDSRKCPEAPTAVSVFQSNNVAVRYITLRDSPQIHINFQYVNLGIVRSIKVQAPWSSPNTDGIHIAFTTNFVVQNCQVSTGDDCISIVTGSHNIAVQNTYCGLGCHGISVGSLGANGEHSNVSQVLVKNCQLESTTNGVRIKTWQGGTGIAANVEFRNIKMTNVSNPITIDQFYCPSSQSGPCSNKSAAVGIDLIKFVNITGTSATSTAVQLACSQSQPCRDIRMSDINITQIGGKTAGAACINAFGVTGGMQVPPSCLAKNPPTPTSRLSHSFSQISTPFYNNYEALP